MSADPSPLVELTAGSLRWFVLPECQDLLLDGHGLRLAEWLDAGQAHVVKHGPHRTVYRVQLPGLDFHLKHYRLADGRAWLRQLVRPSKARLEFLRALAVAARAVPTAMPLALGEQPLGTGPGESYLVTRSLEATEPLSTFLEAVLPTWQPKRQARLRQRLAVALAELVARLHDAGIQHDDLHAANLLLRLDERDEPSLFLIDLHDVRLGSPLPWTPRRENLVILNRWFIVRASRSDRLRFWRAYAGLARSVVGSHPDVARDLETRTWQSNLDFWRNRDRRCRTSNRYYQRLQAPGIRGFAVCDLNEEALAPLLADPDAVFQQPGVVLLKDSRSTTVAEFEMQIDGVPRAMIFKRFRVTSRLDPWLNLVRRSPALRSWVWGQGLRERCLRTARPFAVFHRRRFGLPHEGYLLTEKIPHALDLHEHLEKLSRLPAAAFRAQGRLLLDKLARLVRDLHDRHLSHRDLKAANILISNGEPWLIDLVGIRRTRTLSRRQRVQNLARLHASFHDCPWLTRADRLRFLRMYLCWGLFGRTAWKSWWREITRATEAKVSRNRARGRPLS